MYIALIIFYIIIMLFYISDRLETIKVKYPDFDVHYVSREMTTKDAWAGLFWPILLIWFVIKCLIAIINEIVSFLCILIGYRYNNTKIYNRINKWWI